MTVSMRMMSARREYDYRLKGVVHGDRDTGGTTALTRYYTEEGTPPAQRFASYLVPTRAEQQCELLKRSPRPLA